MRYVLTGAQMKEADLYTINERKIPALTLMERAGEALAKEAEILAPKGKILCVCGGGNNGGDGLVCARILRERGREADVVSFAEKTTAEYRENLQKFFLSDGKAKKNMPKSGYALVVDCLFGTGFHGEATGVYQEAIDGICKLQESGAKVLSADIPSGINGSNGLAGSSAVCADETLCIGEYKTGVFLGDGLDFAGKVVCAHIGIELPCEKEYAKILESEDIARLLPKRKRNSHKGTYGKAAIVAGSVEYSGAALLSALACLRSGAGYTCLFAPKDVVEKCFFREPELLLKSVNEGGRYAFNEEILQEMLSYDAIAYGMGMGVSKDVALGAAWLLKNYEKKLILDADALNSLAKVYSGAEIKALFKSKKCDALLTPHCKEFSRLSSKTVSEILESGVSAAREFSKANGVSLLIKNAVSVIADGERLILNTTGNSGLAKGGSGDVLSGLIAGLCASGLSAFDGGVVGSYLMGKAAEIATRETGEYSLIARDVIANLGNAFLSLSRKD